MLAESPIERFVLVQKAANYFQAQQFDDAIHVFESILELDDRDADAWRSIAICLAEQQRYADALPAYRTALDCRPNDPVTLNEMGKALNHLGRYAEATHVFFDAVEANPRFGEAWHYLAVALERNDQPEDARGAFDRAVTVDPARADAWHDRGCYFSREAKKLLKRHNILLKRHNIPLGVVLLYEALRSYECALSICPSHALASQCRQSILDFLGPDLASSRPALIPGLPTCGDTEEHQ
jgi:tetratricopeptide (TPR) repeat protein